jgi:hypothetical protein
MPRAPEALPQGAWEGCPSKPVSTTSGPEAGVPPLASPEWGERRRAKPVSARGCSLVLAGLKPTPVSIPRGLTARSRWQPSDPPSRWRQPIAAQPGHPPAPRRWAARVGRPELSSAAYGHGWAAHTCTRGRPHAPSASACWRMWRLHCSRVGNVGQAARRWRWAERDQPRARPNHGHWPKSANVRTARRLSAAGGPGGTSAGPEALQKASLMT